MYLRRGNAALADGCTRVLTLQTGNIVTEKIESREGRLTGIGAQLPYELMSARDLWSHHAVNGEVCLPLTPTRGRRRDKVESVEGLGPTPSGINGMPLADIPESWNYFICIELHGVQYMLSRNQSSHVHFSNNTGEVQVLNQISQAVRHGFGAAVSQPVPPEVLVGNPSKPSSALRSLFRCRCPRAGR